MTSNDFYRIFAIAVLILALSAINVPIASAEADATSPAAQSQQDNPAATTETTQPSRETASQPPVQTPRFHISAAGFYQTTPTRHAGCRCAHLSCRSRLVSQMDKRDEKYEKRGG